MINRKLSPVKAAYPAFAVGCLLQPPYHEAPSVAVSRTMCNGEYRILIEDRKIIPSEAGGVEPESLRCSTLNIMCVLIFCVVSDASVVTLQ